jgi:hypothetical protein
MCLQVCRLSVAALGLLQHSQSILSDEAVYAEAGDGAAQPPLNTVQDDL